MGGEAGAPASGKRARYSHGASDWAPQPHTLIDALDDGCLLKIFAFLSPMPDRFAATRVCKRWHGLASDSRMWLRVGTQLRPSENDLAVFGTLDAAVAAARPGDTIVIAPGHKHRASNLRISKPLCLVGGGRSQDDTVLSCSRGSDSALIFHANSRLANLTVRAELGSCLLHKGGRLTIENCALQCLAHPLEHLSCPLVSTADAPLASVGGPSSEVSVAKTRIEGGQRAVQCSGTLALQQVRVMAMKATLLFWFTVAARRLESISAPAS